MSTNMQDNLMIKLKSEFLHARKEKDTFKVGIFSSLIGDLESKAKGSSKVEINDSYIVKTIKVYISNIEQYKSKYTGERLTNAERELEILNSLIPQQLCESELLAYVNQFNTLPELMKYMTANHNGLYDGKKIAMLFNSK
jgi:uncharacterized protein YqeY